MRAPLTRRAALLGTAGLLGGCETFDSIFGERRERFEGNRQPVMSVPERTLAADSAAPAGGIALPPPAPRADWPQQGGDAAHGGGHPALGGTLARSWSSGFGSGTAYRRRLAAGPVAGGGLVFAADASSDVSAFDLASGSRRWRRDVSRENESAGSIGPGLGLAGDTLFVATGLSELLALNAADGTIRWRVDLPAPARGAPTIAEGRVFVPTVASHLVCLSAEDGRRVWTHRATATVTIPFGLPAPAVEGEVVVCGFPSGELFALRATDGRVLWSESLAATGGLVLSDIAGVRASPAISGGRVIAVGVGGLTICVDMRSGRRLWEQETGGTEAAWIAGEWVFLTNDVGQVAAIGRDSGQVRWATSLRPPARGSRPQERIGLSAPVLAGGRLLVGTTGDELVAIDPATGAVAGRISLPGALTLQPIVAGNLLVAATDDATLVAFAGAG
ncbi:PQQ-binding-like beta-propeller repeat protein [Roseomonas sp. CECT 9278]|uniref:outer membrane protein assembly factor BamB family protein n=1 Tax=Roseomonas sp. CECT 9278 TaxID=2845823 RepID=UPI001E377CDD|nr:PQQ-binding-like beta-propeller repeat protein [Roseomonas sp. CECT 9278]CAH0303999.1 Outer membrane protein assembly factor BamB [Roseomonas sp. CECT 9278]